MTGPLNQAHVKRHTLGKREDKLLIHNMTRLQLETQGSRDSKTVLRHLLESGHQHNHCKSKKQILQVNLSAFP
jgi:hypothetical protein